MAGIPGFHPGSPGSIPGQGSKISLHATTHCCLSEIMLTWYTWPCVHYHDYFLMDLISQCFVEYSYVCIFVRDINNTFLFL